jgi:hypothetical protein
MASLIRLGTLVSFLALVTAQSPMIGLPQSVRVASMSFSGSGCPDGTRASVEVDAQNRIYLSTIYMEAVKFSSRSTTDETTKQCIVDIKFRYNRGEHFAIYSHSAEGRFMLKRGMTGSVKTTVQYQSSGYELGTVRVSVIYSARFKGLARLTSRKQTFSQRWDNLQFDRFENYVEREDQDLNSIESIPWSSCSGEDSLNIVLDTNIESGNPGRTDCRDCQTPTVGIDKSLFTMMYRPCRTSRGGSGDSAQLPNQGQNDWGCSTTGSCGPAGFGTAPGQFSPFSGAINPAPAPAPAVPPQSVQTTTIENGIIGF